MPSLEPSPYVFVVGCPRSGTTLLQRMLNAHPHLAVANDTHFIARAVQSAAAGSVLKAASPRHKAELVTWTRHYHRFPRLGVSEEDVDRADAGSETFPEFVEQLYRALAERQGKRLAGEKTPDYVRHLGTLHSLFPETRTLHIVRDGRDVALSLLEWAHGEKGPGRLELWQHEPVAVCALWWRMQVRGQHAAGRLPEGRYLEINYESLVAEPTANLSAIAEFLALPESEEMLRYNRGKARTDPRLSTKKAWLSPTPGLRDWRKQLDSRSVELFEALAGDTLVDNGYELSTRTSPMIARVAEQCRQWWDERFHAPPSELAEARA